MKRNCALKAKTEISVNITPVGLEYYTYTEWVARIYGFIMLMQNSETAGLCPGSSESSPAGHRSCSFCLALAYT